MYAPKGTPAPIVARPEPGAGEGAADRTVGQRFADLGTAPVSVARATPEFHRQCWTADIAKMAAR